MEAFIWGLGVGVGISLGNALFGMTLRIFEMRALGKKMQQAGADIERKIQELRKQRWEDKQRP